MAKVVLNRNSSRKDAGYFKARRNDLCYIVFTTCAMLVVYFILSIGLTFYQRWLLQIYRFPLFVVVCHLVIKYFWARIFRFLWQFIYKKKRVVVDCRNNATKIGPIGYASGLDIGLSNWGIEHITVSLYVMTKSTSIIFILGFALLFKLEKKSWSIIAIVLMISGGLGMFTYKSTQFDLLGFMLVLFASLSSGLRWTLTQFVMQKTEMGLQHPFDMLYYVQPWMLAAIFPLAVIIEGDSLIMDFKERSFYDVSHSLMLVFAGAIIALSMELSEYLIISSRSSLTLSIAGIFKEICTLVLAVEWNGDQMTSLNVIGLLFCLGGIVIHVVYKMLDTSAEKVSSALHKDLLDQASAHFLAEESTTDDEQQPDDSSTEVLFSILNSRNR